MFPKKIALVGEKYLTWFESLKLLKTCVLYKYGTTIVQGGSITMTVALSSVAMWQSMMESSHKVLIALQYQCLFLAALDDGPAVYIYFSIHFLISFHSLWTKFALFRSFWLGLGAWNLQGDIRHGIFNLTPGVSRLTVEPVQPTSYIFAYTSFSFCYLWFAASWTSTHQTYRAKWFLNAMGALVTNLDGEKIGDWKGEKTYAGAAQY